jgi:2-aminoadipate transaminase
MTVSRLARRASHIPGSIIDASVGLLQSQTRDVVRFAMGSPAEEAVPAALLARLCADQLQTPGVFDYGPTEGESSLRAALLLPQPTEGTIDAPGPTRWSLPARQPPLRVMPS